MKKFRLQERTFVGLKQWKTPRYGTRSIKQMTPWKTIGTFDTLREADYERCKRFIGLFERRVMYGAKVVIEPDGHIIPEFMPHMRTWEKVDL